MKRMFLLLGAVLFLVAAFVPGATANAANVACTVSPAEGDVNTTFVISCSGLVPGELTTAWLTEPDGAARAWPGARADSAGNVGFSFTPYYDPGYYVAALGTWGFTVEQSGLVGVVHFTVTGGAEDVAGAVLTADGKVVTGSGFAPFEPVSVWYEFPNGDCSSKTHNYVDGLNSWVYIGDSTVAFGTLKANAAGEIGFTFFPVGEGFDYPCIGSYRVVARGVNSGLGAQTFVVFEGESVAETASLVANTSVVNAFGGVITFSGAGFGANELINCWLTTPQGAVDAVGGFGGQPRADAGGNVGLSLVMGGNTGFFAWSEGALGEWALTCQGLSSGGLGIARFTVEGNAIDP